MLAFTDSVDGGGYSTGICGEKQITLNPGSPAFLTLVPDSTDPTLNNFSIDYDQSAATESDIGTLFTVSYTVTIKEYSGITVDHTASFTFEIKCPSTYTEDSFSGGAVTNYFNLLTDTTIQITLPTLSGIPLSCHSVTWNVLRQTDNQDMEVAMPAVFSIGATALTLTHSVGNYADSLSLFGSATYFFQGTVTGAESPTSPTSDFTFVIDFTDTCRSATVVA